MRTQHKTSRWFILLLLIASTSLIRAQVQIENYNDAGRDKKTESFSALELSSTTGGLRLPRLTTDERNNLSVSGNKLAEGLLIYNMTDNVLEYWDGTKWVRFNQTTGNFTATPDINISNGDAAVLKDFSTSIKPRVIGLQHLYGGEKNMVYATDPESGDAVLIPFNASSALQAQNGLTAKTDIVELGGDLIRPTSIDINKYNLEIKSTSTGLLNVNNTALLVNPATANVGAGRPDPRLKMDINGAIATGEQIVPIEAGSRSVDLSPAIAAGQIVIDGTPGGVFKITAGKGIPGQRLAIYNRTLKVGTLDGHPINPKRVELFTYSGDRWRALSPATTILNMYVGKAIIPPHANAKGGGVADFDLNSDTRFDTPDWKVISKKSTNYKDDTGTFGDNTYTSSHLEVLYEYQGVPFDVNPEDHFCSFLTPIDTENSGIVFNVSSMGLSNASGKTQLKIGFTRVDYYDRNSDWATTAGLNLMIINSSR